MLLIFLLNVLGKYDILILEKESTHSKVDAPRWFLNVLTDIAYPVCRQDRHFYFRLFLLLRKASNAITRLPKAHNNVSMPRKIERISKAVIGATSLPMYSGKPVIGVGRLPPCHGYFPMAFATLLIYHFSCHNSTIFVNSFVLIFSYFLTVCYAFLSFTIS